MDTIYGHFDDLQIEEYKEKLHKAIMSLLQAALNETRSDDFNYRSYRKLILDAHSLVDKINSRS